MNHRFVQFIRGVAFNISLERKIMLVEVDLKFRDIQFIQPIRR
jgi:hypothetical protein